MKAAFLTIALAAAFVITAIAFAAAPATPDATPAQVIAKQKKTIASLRDQRDSLRDENAAQDDLIASQADTISRLRARDPLDAVLARDPDGLWAAVQAIWRVFPTLPAGSLCGYDRSATQNDALTPASFTFYRWQIC